MNPVATASSRRSFLGGAAAGGASFLARSLLAEAAGEAPARLLVIHRPCGTVPDRWFPSTAGPLTLSPILRAFAPVQATTTVFGGIRCPRDTGWRGDQHGAGLITMMTGRRFGVLPGTNPNPPDPNFKSIVAAGKSIDQHLLIQSPRLRGTPIGSLQLTAYADSASDLPVYRVMSYRDANAPLFPESRPEQALGRVFGTLPSGSAGPADTAALSRGQGQQRSVLDFLYKDLDRLARRIPASQKPKLDVHRDGLRDLERTVLQPITPAVSGGRCVAPVFAPAGTGGRAHVATARAQLAIIRTAFQCDLTRVATFSFAHGNSELGISEVTGMPFSRGGAHHRTSHGALDSAGEALEAMETLYANLVAEMLQQMKDTPEGQGSLLDNTLVVYLNEVGLGRSHSADNMPVVLVGGARLGHKGGRYLDVGGRYMNDLWSSVAGAFGVTLEGYGDAAYSRGPIAGLFA